ncbi:MAG: hypothetical protein E6K14_06880 [Methanobacteriota archaeon]|nr:MAG: hypothetical protein E6K14_06880 [Euryarchaeota archaeon]
MRPHDSRSAPRSIALALVLIGVAWGVLVFTAPSVAATHYVRGLITVDTVWGNDANDTTYVVMRDVTVRAPAKLTIQPGTTVKFDPGTHLFINGSLVADGTSGKLITFGPNNTASVFPWAGVQFNSSSSGSVSWSTFDRADRAVTALSSSPSLHDNTVIQAGVGFALVSSGSDVSHNTIRRAAAFGIYMNASSGTVDGNVINGTAVAIDVEQPSTPTISANTITNVSGAFAVGILISRATADVSSNVITGIQGARGGNAIVPGTDGQNGAIAFGIYVTGAPSASIIGNTIDTIVGGRGGDGAANSGGLAGRGGNGGAAAGIVVVATPNVLVQANSVTGVSGGRGGTGGGSGTTSVGGRGGDAGTAVAVEIAFANVVGQVERNQITIVSGGIGGSGGHGVATDGNGGFGGDAYGVFLFSVAQSNATSNTVQVLRGGLGGNTSSNGAGTGFGAAGGGATGIEALSVIRSADFDSNIISTLTGGDGGRGVRGGHGGNATAAVALGNNDAAFNATALTGNDVQAVTGGAGGIGALFGGNGGSAAGLAPILVTPTLVSNSIATLQGGKGGDAVDGNDGGRGGDAIGIIGGFVANGWSSGDSISGVTKGGVGAGPPAQVSYADGVYILGNATFTSRLTIDNGTFTSVGSYDFYVDNYTEAVALNTPFATHSVQAAGNLTVRNFLEVDVYWPNALTLVAGAHILVDDNGSPIWDASTTSGIQSWILVTDRRYINSNAATDNRTTVKVSYGSYGFQNNPRGVDMATSHPEAFVMIDRDAPTSAASALPAYENSRTFSVGYSASDGNGTGVANVTLWYRTGGSATWTSYATQSGNIGQFSFTAAADGTYEFATTAIDLAGNAEATPGANDTWTIVDTVRPGSHVDPLPAYETSSSFLVSWSPDPGVTDIATFTIQYFTGGGWVNWLVNTPSTSGTFNAGAQGVYAFRSIATDAAGNVEVPPAGNDTWTIVDTVLPFSHTRALSPYQTSTSFAVAWEPLEGTMDIATFEIDVRDNGGGWTIWIPSTSAVAATFASGVDGHTYEFRSLATDRAGNRELPLSGNDSWTIVDMTAPDSSMIRLPAYENVLQFTISWGPVAGTSDIAAYRVQSKDGAGAWTDFAGYTDTTATSASFVGADAHVYAFRTIARDRAGNVEPTPAVNDTWTIVDVTRPYVTATEPIGANTNTTPLIRVTFSEPMDQSAVQQAFSITPDINGMFTWSADSRVVTFTPARELQAGTPYFVVIVTGARDLAGNSMLQAKSFGFTTASASLTLSDFWWVLLVVGAVVGGTLFLVMRRRAASSSKPAPATSAKKGSEAILEDVFLLYHRDGLLIKHETRRLRPDIDTDILSGMLTAVQAFVKDALRGDDSGDLNEMTVGHMHILIGRGKWLVLAARIEGDGSESWTDQIQRCIQDMEDHHWDQLEDWDGDMALAGVLAPYVKKLIRGEYA